MAFIAQKVPYATYLESSRILPGPQTSSHSEAHYHTEMLNVEKCLLLLSGAS